MSDINKKRQKNGIRLIATAEIKPIKNASGMDHIFQYQGFCKITINQLQSLLYVDPSNEEFLPISAMFKWKFFAQKNIVFVLAEHHFQDFMLVFNNEIRCENVLNLMNSKRAMDTVTNEEIYQRILSRLLNQISKNANITVLELLKKWLNKLDKEDKQFYIKKTKDDEVFHLIYPENESIGEVNENDEGEIRMSRKRKFCKVNSNRTSGDDALFENGKIGLKNRKGYKFVQSDLLFIMVKIKGKTMKRLLIFPSSDKEFCYEYCQNPRKLSIFYCQGCRIMGINVRAKVEQNEKLLLQDQIHVCKKVRYSAEKYIDIQIVRKPDYEVLENCNTNSGKVLILFNPNDRTQCHDYRWRSYTKSFCCVSCDAEARIYNVFTENEYVELLKLNHECKFRPFDREQYFKFNDFLHSSEDFELRNEMNGEKERKTLIIFDQKDKTKCYIYRYHKADKNFVCKKCSYQKVNVTAKLNQNDENENYLVLSKRQHVCEPEKYTPQKNDDIILRSPDIKVMEKTSVGVPKVFVFVSTNKSLCYVFSPAKKNGKRYICRRCHDFINRKTTKNGDKSNGVVYLTICKTNDGEYFIQMKNQKHSCQPQKYEPEKYEIDKIKTAEKYFYFRKKSLPTSCNSCQYLKNTVYISPPKKDKNGKEVFIHDPKKHICKPIKASSIQTPDFQRLERKDITFGRFKRKEVKVDEKRIVRLPNFEFRPSRNGNPEGTLVFFAPKDKSLCYEYYCCTGKELYICSNCGKKKCFVTAKVHVDDESNEKYLELSEKEHICEPIKDEFPNKVINASNFTVINRDDETKPTKVLVFTSETKEFYYEMLYMSSYVSFECKACIKLKKHVNVKLYSKENGEEYLLKLKNDHICTPKKYDERNFEPPKTVQESMFQLYKNEKGEANKKLVIFTSEKKDLVYEYCLKNSVFHCPQCSKLNKNVTAKICENNGKYVELSKIDHVCKPQKFDPKKYKK